MVFGSQQQCTHRCDEGMPLRPVTDESGMTIKRVQNQFHVGLTCRSQNGSKHNKVISEAYQSPSFGAFLREEISGLREECCRSSNRITVYMSFPRHNIYLVLDPPPPPSSSSNPNTFTVSSDDLSKPLCWRESYFFWIQPNLTCCSAHHTSRIIHWLYNLSAGSISLFLTFLRLSLFWTSPSAPLCRSMLSRTKSQDHSLKISFAVWTLHLHSLQPTPPYYIMLAWSYRDRKSYKIPPKLVYKSLTFLFPIFHPPTHLQPPQGISVKSTVWILFSLWSSRFKSTGWVWEQVIPKISLWFGKTSKIVRLSEQWMAGIVKVWKLAIGYWMSCFWILLRVSWVVDSYLCIYSR